MINPPLPYDIDSNGESIMDDGQGRRVEPAAPVAAYLQGLCVKVMGCDYAPTPEEFGTVLGMAMGREGARVPAGDPVPDGGAVDPISVVQALRDRWEADWCGLQENRRWQAMWSKHSAIKAADVILEALRSAACTVAPQLDPDLETAITTLLTQVGSSHEAYPGAKRDLVRAFLARHGAEARGEVGAGDASLADISVLVELYANQVGVLPGQNCADDPDEDAVGWTGAEEGQPAKPDPITFGHVRRALAGIRTLARRARAQVEPAGDPVRDGGEALRHDAREAARAWLHGYGIRTERYIACGGDHPAMDTLPTAFETFALAMRLPPLEPPPPATTQPEPGAGEDDAAWIAKVRDRLRDVERSLLSYRGRPVDARRLEDWCADIGSLHSALGPVEIALARRDARAPVAGGEPMALPENEWGSVREYVADYTLETDAPHKPTEFERFLLEDAITGYVEGYAHPPAPPAPTAERLCVDEPALCERCHGGPCRGHQAPPAAPVGDVSEGFVPPMTTPDQIAELRRLLAAATPGPWGEFRADENDGVDNEEFFICSPTTGVAEECNEADAALIAALRNAATGLLDDLDALRRENAELRETLKAVTWRHDSVLRESHKDTDGLSVVVLVADLRCAARLIAEPAPETREA